MNNLLERIKLSIIAGHINKEDDGFDGTMTGLPGVTELVHQALEQKLPAVDIMTESLSAAMEEVGRLYEAGEYWIPDMLASAECVKRAMSMLNPLLVSEKVKNKGKFLICTVRGDLHDIGKNIVATMLMGAGYDVIDLGKDVSADTIVQTLIQTKALYLGLSALLTSTMVYMEEIIDSIAKEELRNKVKILIGGAPVDDAYARKIGADFYCVDAFDAIRKLNQQKKPEE
jgi:5-methyltetrahydrofolate--homocysteine methyltransferase